MVEQNGIYKCEHCGNIVSVIEAKAPPIICCGEPMKLLKAKTTDEGKEKHVPIIEIDGNNVKVKVGDIPHPMEEEHHIVLIQIVKNGKVITGKRLYAGDAPEAEFCLENTEGISAKEICNVHGLWTSN